MARHLSVSVALVAALLLPLALAACGRAGPLDPPPGAAAPPPPTRYIDPTTPTGGAQEAPPPNSAAAATQPQKKTFILDFLLK